MYMVYEHGGDIYRNKVRLDFSVNTNPLGMSENVKKAIAENIEQFGIYPDAMCINLRNILSRPSSSNVVMVKWVTMDSSFLASGT